MLPPSLSATTQDSWVGCLFLAALQASGSPATAHLAGMYAALRDEEGTGPLQGPVQVLEARMDLLIQESDSLFE